MWVRSPGFSLEGWLMGGFLTLGYCLRTIGSCLSYNCSLEIFVGGGQGLDVGGQSHDEGDLPQSPHWGKP